MRLDIVSIFPEYLSPLTLSLVGKACETGTVDLRIHDLRDFTHDKHRTVDDTPFGGGPGMVMKAQPWGEAVDSIIESGTGAAMPALVIPTPSGAVFDQPAAAHLSELPWIVIACGRYEGIDGRVAEHYEAQGLEVLPLSIGDYVLAGGEAAALVMAEAAIRLLPGVLGNAASAPDDSFSPDRTGAALEGPVFTKPQQWRGLDVPEVLLSGNHAAIAAHRLISSAARTQKYRPDLAG